MATKRRTRRGTRALTGKQAIDLAAWSLRRVAAHLRQPRVGQACYAPFWEAAAEHVESLTTTLQEGETLDGYKRMLEEFADASEQARAAGHAARTAGAPAGANPHKDELSTLRLSWLFGWEDAAREAGGG